MEQKCTYPEYDGLVWCSWCLLLTLMIAFMKWQTRPFPWTFGWYEHNLRMRGFESVHFLLCLYNLISVFRLSFEHQILIQYSKILIIFICTAVAYAEFFKGVCLQIWKSRRSILRALFFLNATQTPHPRAKENQKIWGGGGFNLTSIPPPLAYASDILYVMYLHKSRCMCVARVVWNPQECASLLGVTAAVELCQDDWITLLVRGDPYKKWI